MPTIKKEKSETVTEEIEVTPDFCFQKAAEALLAGCSASSAVSSAPGSWTYTGPTEAAEWRQLGDTIHWYNEDVKRSEEADPKPKTIGKASK